METTCDGILNKRVRIEQPAEGYRMAVDTVLLAAAVPARPGDKILDIGCGVGGAFLCLAARVPEIHITGIDIQHDLITLCRRNIELNQLKHAQAVVGDVTRLFERHCTGMMIEGFDQVMMNPPFHEEARHTVSENTSKSTANAEKTGDLARWITAAAKALKPDGMLTLIHRADRLQDILGEGEKHFGAQCVLPIIARAGTVPKRILIRMRKGERQPVLTCKSFVLYGPDNRYCQDADAVIRDAKALEFNPL